MKKTLKMAHNESFIMHVQYICAEAVCWRWQKHSKFTTNKLFVWYLLIIKEFIVCCCCCCVFVVVIHAAQYLKMALNLLNRSKENVYLHSHIMWMFEAGGKSTELFKYKKNSFSIFIRRKYFIFIALCWNYVRAVESQAAYRAAEQINS